LLSLKKLSYHVTHYAQCSRHVSQIILQSENDFIDYAAGQYIKVMHPDESTSALSIASSPVEKNRIELHVSHPPINPRAHEILKWAKQKKEIILRGAYGACTVERFEPQTDIIFFVRGTGFAPVKAFMEVFMEKLQGRANQPVFHLFWAAAPEDFYLQELLVKWEKALVNFRVTQVASRTKDQHKLQHAVVSEYPDLSLHQVYASGPFGMVEDGMKAFIQHGLPENKFYSDIFDYDENA
jgi:CDP-4-dehydro-6-deoxyglucose reductase